MLQLRTLAGLALAGSLGALAGCLVTNQNHCALNQGSCDEGLECSVCAVENNGCVAAGSILEETCVFVSATSNTSTGEPSTQGPDPTVTETSVDTDTTSSTTVGPTTSDPTTIDPSTETTDTTITTDSTTQATDCMGDIVENIGCGGTAPYCVDEVCVSCKSIDCGASFPDKPTCDESMGLCVQCVDDDDCDEVDKPACNTETATCEGCTSHTQCPDTACDFETGACFPPENVFFVQNQTGKCADKDGYGLTAEKPFCTLPEALGRVVLETPTTIKVANAVLHQTATNALPPGKYTVAIVQTGGTPPSMAHTTSDPFLYVQAENRVFVNLINMRNEGMPLSNPAVLCEGGDTGASVWLDRVRITNTRSAVKAENCRVHVRRSVITGQTYGGIDMVAFDQNIVESKLWLENSFITDGPHNAFGAIRLSVDASADILYSTIALNVGTQIECQNLDEGSVVVRNSVVVGETPIQACLSEPETSFISSDIDQSDIDMIFSGFMSGVFQAKIAGGLSGLAMWLEGDPAIDFDGNTRPSRPGPDYAGADRPE
jgi:hypothetical protein